MITEKREEAVLAEVEKLYLEHGETSKYYCLITRYEDVKQFADQNRENEYLQNLAADLKKIIMKHHFEYFD